MGEGEDFQLKRYFERGTPRWSNQKKIVYWTLTSKIRIEGFSNFNIYSHSVQPYKYDRKQSNLPISIHFSIFNIRYIYLTHTSSMRRNETHKQLNIFETKQKWKNNSKTTKIDTIESVYQY